MRNKLKMLNEVEHNIWNVFTALEDCVAEVDTNSALETIRDNKKISA
jgi:hypothetical protein